MKTSHQIIAALALLQTTTAVAQPAGEATIEAATNTAPAAEVDTAVAVEPATTAAPTETVKPRKHKRHHVRMALELSAIFAVGHQWYWRDGGEPNRVDWQLGFGGDALKKKLTGFGDGWRFDGNEYNINALGHPGFGTMTHFLARTNGYSVGESFLISTLASGSWECLVEWAEYGSLNDLAMTSPAGIPLGETAYQFIHHYREASYQFSTGVGSENGAAMAVVSARGDLNRIPMHGDGRFAAGQHVGFAAELTGDHGMRGVEGGAKATLGGIYRNRTNSALQLGVSTEFDYRNLKDRPEREWNQQAMMAIGPTLDVQLRRRDVTIDMGTDLYAEFALVKSQAFAAWRADNQAMKMRNVMQTWEQPYYYGGGVTVDPRINVSYRGYKVGGKVTASLFHSIDSGDRDAEMMTDNVHFRDTEARGEAWMGYEMNKMSVTVDGRINRKDGTVGGTSDSTTDHTVMATVGYKL
ncbi:MAG TPA: DUF3943 domain-containing protein [Kofleriaceae bacterium]